MQPGADASAARMSKVISSGLFIIVPGKFQSNARSDAEDFSKREKLVRMGGDCIK